MNKKTIYIILIILILLISFIIYIKYHNKNQFTNNVTPTTITLIGGDKDKHDCLIGAGYQWCESKQECQRLWEGNCPPDFIKKVTFVESKDGVVIYYEEPGKPALAKNFIFDGKCKVNNVLCKDLKIKSGTTASIKGNTLESEILITEIEF